MNASFRYIISPSSPGVYFLKLKGKYYEEHKDEIDKLEEFLAPQKMQKDTIIKTPTDYILFAIDHLTLLGVPYKKLGRRIVLFDFK